MPKNIGYKIAFVSWLVFVTFSSLFSFSGRIKDPGFNLPHSDKFVHFIFYFVLVFLGVLAAKEINKSGVRLKKTVLHLFLFAFFYGICIEFLQHNFTDDRQGDVWDVLANTLGAAVAVVAVSAYLNKRTALK